MSRPSIGLLRPPRATGIVEIEVAESVFLTTVRRSGVPLVEFRAAFPLSASQVRDPAQTSVLSTSLMAGTRDLDRSQLAASIERMGAELQASVERDYFLISGSVLAPNLRLLIDVVSQLVAGALYPVQEVKADRDRSADESAIALSRPEVLADEALR